MRIEFGYDARNIEQSTPEQVFQPCVQIHFKEGDEDIELTLWTDGKHRVITQEVSKNGLIKCSDDQNYLSTQVEESKRAFQQSGGKVTGNRRLQRELNRRYAPFLEQAERAKKMNTILTNYYSETLSRIAEEPLH